RGRWRPVLVCSGAITDGRRRAGGGSAGRGATTAGAGDAGGADVGADAAGSDTACDGPRAPVASLRDGASLALPLSRPPISRSGMGRPFRPEIGRAHV